MTKNLDLSELLTPMPSLLLHDHIWEDDMLGSAFDELFPCLLEDVGLAGHHKEQPAGTAGKAATKLQPQMNGERAGDLFSATDRVGDASTRLRAVDTDDTGITRHVLLPRGAVASSAHESQFRNGHLDSSIGAGSGTFKRKATSPPEAVLPETHRTAPKQCHTVATSKALPNLSVRNTRKEVLRLEQLLQEKQQQLEKLQEQNQLLKRKEKLLQISVENQSRMSLGPTAKGSQHKNGSSARNSATIDSGSHAAIAALMQTFRTQLGQMEAKRSQKSMGEPKAKGASSSMSVEDFRGAFRSYYTELSALLMEYTAKRDPDRLGELAADREWCEACCTLSDKARDAMVEICLNHPMTAAKARGINMQTGEQEEPPEGHWAKVTAALALSAEQRDEMEAAFEIFTASYSRVTAECARLGKEIQVCCASGGALCSGDEKATRLSTARYIALSDADPRLLRLQAGFKRGLVLEMMLAFLGLGLMTPGQRSMMTLMSWPYYPNMQLLLQHIHSTSSTSKTA